MTGSPSGSCLIRSLVVAELLLVCPSLIFRSFLCRASFIRFCILPIFVYFLFLVIIRISTRIKSNNFARSDKLTTACFIVLFEFVNCDITASILARSAWKDVAEENVWM